MLLAFLSYGIGVAVALLLVIVAVWADMEATVYGFERLAGGGLHGLTCPIMMARNETRTIHLNVSNPTEGRISPSIKTQISTRLVPVEFLETFALAPGESKELEWQVGPQNIDLGRFIFAKVLLYSAYPLPSQETTCGIFIVNLPGDGRVILSVLIALSLVTMGWSVQQLNRYRASNEWLGKYFGGLIFLAALASLGLIISLIGSWIVALLMMLLALLTIVILLGSLLLADHGPR